MQPEVTTAAGYLLNRTPRQKYQWRTPWEVLQDYYNTRNQIDHDPRPKIGHIRIFGCRAYPLIQNQPKLAKLEARTSIGYLVGWDSTNVFRVWIPSLQKVIRTRDVTFDETLKFDPNQVEQPLPQPAIEVINLISITDFDQYYDSVPIDQSIDLVQSQGPAIPLLQPQTLLNTQSQEVAKYTEDPIGATTENQGLITPGDTPESTPAPEIEPEPEFTDSNDSITVDTTQLI